MFPASRFAARLVVPATLALVLPATRAAAQRAYVAATSETVFSSTEERQSDPPVHLMFVENRSTVPVTVFSVSLTGCENVKVRCDPQRVNIRIEAGHRRQVLRVEPKSAVQGFTYRFSFGWRADSSSIGAVAAMADAGDAGARQALAARRRADSLDRVAPGPRASELTRADFATLGRRAAALRAVPESLVLVPGQRTSVDRVSLVVVDSQGAVLGRTRWIRWQAPGGNTVEFAPPGDLVARRTGRAVYHFGLAPEAQALVATPLADVDVPVVVAYPADPHAPVFGGVGLDADTQTPLACTRVALEDSAQNVVARGHTAPDGAFTLMAPRPGSYRVRFETLGWSPVYGPTDAAAPDDFKQRRFAVRFTEALVALRSFATDDDFVHAAPTAVVATPTPTAARPAVAGSARSAQTAGSPPTRAAAAPIVRGVTLTGSASLPTLGITGGAPPGTTWVQFVVDSAGRVDPASALLPPDTDTATRASVQLVLPRIRFSPAREAGAPVCELLRMQVDVNLR